MADVSNELLYEVLKSIQQRLDRFEHKIDELKSEMNSVRGHLVSIQQDVANIYGTLGRHDEWLERIDNRLELNDVPTPT